MKKAAFLSNININALKFQFKKEYDTFFARGYDTWRQELLEGNSDLFKFAPEFCFLIIDGEELANTHEVDNIEAAFRCIENAAQNLPTCRFFISDLDVSTVHIDELKEEDEARQFEYEWQKRLGAALKEYKNVYRFPLREIVISLGRNSAYSQKMWYMASNRFSVTCERLIAARVRELIRPALNAAKKCLVLDLDNTLWGGVIGEDGAEGIALDVHGEGARYYDFQKTLKEIHDKGVLLAIASRNNEDDMNKAFAHPRMLLKKTDFSAISVGWDTKSGGITRISEDLNIGLDSIVFIDDNPVEREEVRQRLQDVVTADFPEDTAELPQFAVEVYNRYFYSFDMSEEDSKKTVMYAENARRNDERKLFASLDDFLIGMDIKLAVAKADSSTLLRAYQMTQKTNQFNVSTRRYSEAELLEMSKDDRALLLLGHVWDKYGDNGNSILAVIRLTQAKEAEIESFLMSCRIMNRGIEFGFLYEAEKLLVSMGVDTVFAAFIPSAKNSPAAMFFEDAGYEVTANESGSKRYKYALTAGGNKERKKCFVTIV